MSEINKARNIIRIPYCFFTGLPSNPDLSEEIRPRRNSIGETDSAPPTWNNVEKRQVGYFVYALKTINIFYIF